MKHQVSARRSGTGTSSMFRRTSSSIISHLPALPKNKQNTGRQRQKSLFKLSGTLDELPIGTRINSVRSKPTLHAASSPLEKNINRLTSLTCAKLDLPQPKTEMIHFPQVELHSPYIDQYYPNASCSHFCNKVVFPGDWEFNKQAFLSFERTEARSSELRSMLKPSQKQLAPADNGNLRPSTLRWAPFEGIGNVPSVREGATLTALRNKVVFYGGQNHLQCTGVYSLDFEKQHWKQCQTYYTPAARSGHCAVSCDRILVVWGGWSSTSPQKRKCSKKLLLLNSDAWTWTKRNPTGDVPSRRAFAAASAIGRTMVMFGGLTPTGHGLGDLHTLDMLSAEWTSLASINQSMPVARSHSTLTAVFPRENMNVWTTDVHSSYQLFYNNGNGFYLFGGLSAEGKALNDLWILKFSPQGCYWTLVDRDNAPEPRYSHTSAYMNGLFFVFGGRGDSVTSSLTDLHVFRVEKRQWECVNIVGSAPASRWMHATTVVQEKVLIFGGKSYKRQVDNQVFVLELDEVSRVTP